ncbi:MAG: hypothetical protein ACI4MK_00230 [Aristaeellaceae bacterium]
MNMMKHDRGAGRDMCLSCDRLMNTIRNGHQEEVLCRVEHVMVKQNRPLPPHRDRVICEKEKEMLIMMGWPFEAKKMGKETWLVSCVDPKEFEEVHCDDAE